MAKIGRPKLNNAEARKSRLHVALTEAERLELIQRADRAGFASMSDFVRTASLKRAMPTRQKPQDVFSPDDRKALVNLGNNLNQIARARHAGRDHVMTDQLAETIEKLDALFDRYLPS